MSLGRTLVLMAVMTDLLPVPAQAGERHPPPKKEANMTKPTDAGRDFVFTFRDVEDRITSDLYGHMEVIKIDARTGRSLFLENSKDEDAPGAVGLFGVTLPPKEIDALIKILDGIKWGQLPDPVGGDFMSPTLEIEYTRGTEIVRRGFNAASHGPFMRAVGPLVDLMGELMGEIRKHPVRAVNATLEKTAAGVKLSLKNVGTGTVIVSDGRSVGAKRQGMRGGFSVLSCEPSGKPLSYTPEPLAVQTDGKDHPPLTLAPGQVHELASVPFAPTTPGKYRVTGHWMNYDRPAIAPENVMPMLPEPKELDDTRPYFLLGAAFSREITYDVPAAPR
jgi:hypothetical protein